MRRVWLLGAGGHAKVVIDTLRSAGSWRICGLLDDDPRLLGGRILDVPVVGPISEESLASHGVEHAIIAVGSNRARSALAARLAGRLAWATAVHPASYVAPGVKVGEGTLVCAGAVIQPDATIGPHAIVNTSSSVDHDSVVGPFAHVAPGARLAGGVRVGEGALLGIGCCVIPRRTVGAWATVGAGAVVVTDIPPGVTARGVPARHSTPETIG